MEILVSHNQNVVSPVKSVHLSIKREDLIHPFVSGNKYRKLKYNLARASALGKNTLLTFGGAFSNHIVAVAAAGKLAGYRTIGIIRGDELEAKINSNPTLQTALNLGMQLHFITRENYRLNDTPDFQNRLHAKYGDFYLIPEGGTNHWAVQGCEEILTASDIDFDFICCAVGTGGTIAGLSNSAHPNQQVLGFPVLKEAYLNQEIAKFAPNTNWKLLRDYHFGGYAKINQDLIRFMNKFYRENGILLDPVYTGKMMYGLYDLIEKDYFAPGAKILAIHTGGLQGIKGMNLQLANKHLPLIDTYD